MKIIDLTIPCDNQTEGVDVQLQQDLPVYLGHECYAYDLNIKSHTGTYFETSAHLFRNGKTTDSISPEQLILPGVCLKIEKSELCITADDLDNAAKSLDLFAGTAVLIDTGTREKSRSKYFSHDAAEWMADKGVSLMGSSTPLYDKGFENPTGFFIPLFKADIPIIANIINLERLPLNGFELFVLPLRIKNVCTVPCRVIAILENNII
jgi:kynurenine formamidase